LYLAVNETALREVGGSHTPLNGTDDAADEARYPIRHDGAIELERMDDAVLKLQATQVGACFVEFESGDFCFPHEDTRSPGNRDLSGDA
jgi:hypothetical protein